MSIELVYKNKWMRFLFATQKNKEIPTVKCNSRLLLSSKGVKYGILS